MKGVFDRQIRIQNWNQDRITNQNCLLLGTGGLGCGVAMGLARLGVRKIILVDRDIVDETNLNRQILFTPADVGLPKVDQAKLRLQVGHQVREDMQIETFNLDVLEQFQTIVQIMTRTDEEEIHVVFNMIDCSEYWDAVVQSLCMYVGGRLLITGGTFCQQLTVDLYRARDACMACGSYSYETPILEKLIPSKITEYEKLDFIPMSENPIS